MKEVKKEVGKFSSFDGTSIYYESHGEGPPIILIYGICCVINHWHHQIAYFAQNYRVIAFDLRGHHRSSAPQDPEQLTIASTAKDVLTMMDHLGIERAHLIGHSFGVPVLIDFASRYSDRALTLSFINGFAQNPIEGMFGLNFVGPTFAFLRKQYERAPALWREIWRVSTDNALMMWATTVAGGFNIKVTQFKDIEIYARGVSQISLDVMFPMFEDMMAFDGTNMLKKIAAPTLIIAGEKDAVTPARFQEDLHRLVRGSEYVIVPYGSHCTQLDFPEYVNLRLERHLQQHR